MENNLKEKIKNLPLSSGVYIMKNENDEIIYIGKAKNLKARVSQYFQNSKKAPKVQLMVDNISSFEYIITPSELDAFILENTLIKKHQPFFNILLKDGKQYPYIKTNLKENFPKFSVVRKVKNDGAKYFGPYFGKINAYELLKTINYAYPIRTCKNEIKINKVKRPCLNYSLGLCSAPCCEKISKDNYREIVNKAISFLNGNEKEMKKVIQKKMEIASQNENFEVAIMLRDRLKMIEELSKKTVVDIAKDAEIDVFTILEKNSKIYINLLILRAGKILGMKNYDIDELPTETAELLINFILQYYSNKILPKKILTNINLDFNLIKEALKKLYNKTIEIIIPKKGINKKLLDMSLKNLSDHIEKDQLLIKEDINIKMIESLKNKLYLEKIPIRMECYDISHISGTNKVGSMVVFNYGKPLKSDYRKFKIKTIEGNNDFACLQEVLERRIKNFEKKEDISFSKKPDLIIIDGGKGQLSSVIDIIKNTAFYNVPIISLAKKFEEIYTPNNSYPTIFSYGSLELRLLQNIRDEAHRFAITFHRELRNKTTFN